MKQITAKEKLIKRVKEELGYEIYDLESLRTGANQKASGAVSWVGKVRANPPGYHYGEVAGYETMTKLSRAKVIKAVRCSLIPDGRNLIIDPGYM